MPARTRKQVRVTEELMYCGIPSQPEPSCWKFRFFEAHSLADRDGPPADECQSGDCRRHPPIIDHARRDAEANWAEFPMVMACDWCGEFAPRAALLGQSRVDQPNDAFDVASQQHGVGSAVSPVAGSPEQLHDHVAHRSH